MRNHPRRLLTVAAITAVALAGTTAAAPLVAMGAPGTPHGGGSTTILHTVLTGEQEVPGPGDEDGTGVFVAAVRGDRLCYLLTARKVATPTAAHIHAAPKGSAGGIVVGLRTPAGGHSHGCLTAVPDAENTPATLTESELAAILADRTGFYANVHNADFPAGAIRGQLR